ncbi:transglycosylase domain-containing protein [Streptomyces antioxidans]|uniref:Transglycosylase domain-containing protein n=1 Tax=Streptomyces antioxidans TaxID=1507734 RepID=A0A1V4D1U2_9ACTN|nr:transglycosylase family protein [Streptomyces antioxidans]OPF77186.1 transglycosylase domain-containing protein [Streptomyces antioxidans]
MRSGNGRHRRPRQAPAIIVAAGVTGAGLALPLLGASGAQAAQTATWDHVAECESGGMWSANEGNGFYGGLQLTLDMWKSYGGTAYAPRPDLASRSQQISVAEAILDDRGPDAWPSCALGAGLTDGGGAPDVDPGGTATPDPGTGRGGDGSGDRGRDGSSSDADRSDSGGSDADRSGASGGADGRDGSDGPNGQDAPDASGSAEEPQAPHTSESPGGLDGSASDDPASNGPSDPDDPSESDGSKNPSADPSSSGRHRGSPDAGERADDGGAGGGRPSGRHASRGASDRDDGSSGDDYTVRPGDNLSGIAEHQNVARGWEGLYETNEDLIGADPDLIIPGQRLDLTIREQ